MIRQTPNEDTMRPLTTRRTPRLLPAWTILLGWTSISAGQDVPSPQPTPPGESAQETQAGKGKWLPVFEQHAADYVVTAGPSPEAKLLPAPLLRWSQPIRGGDDGALYLWIRQGRPVAAVTFFTFRWPRGERVIVHERHSFAAGPLEATWRGQPTWTPTAPGLTFKPLPEAQPPAETGPTRLRQMQAMIRDVAATTTDAKGSNWTMRALTKPLHRYEAPDDGLTDGALFALAQGTDPEAFFFLETRGQGKEAHWEYAIARFTDLAIRVDYRGQKVFTGPATLGRRSEIYFANTVMSKPSDSPEDFRPTPAP